MTDFMLRPLLIAALSTLAWAAYAGTDYGWDVINHHLYLPFAMLHGRTFSDFYAAGPQSYQNPVGYLPLYAMVTQGLPAWAIGAVLALAHSLNLLPVYGLAKRCWPEARGDGDWVFLACAMAWVSPQFLIVAGTSSIDPFASLLALSALYAVVTLDHDAGALWKVTVAGVALGMATALKLSNAVFFISIWSVLVYLSRNDLRRWKLWGTLCLGASVGFIALAGVWCMGLYRHFGNPIYPLYNDIFKSPFASTAPMLANRFVPNSISGYLSRIWEMAEFKFFVTAEAFLPDIRPLVLGVLLLSSPLPLLRPRPTMSGATLERRPTELDVALLLFVLVSYLLWMKTSGNARYAIPLFLVAGLLLTRWGYLALPGKVSKITIMLILALQFGYYASAGMARFVAAPWSTGPFLQVKMPEQLIKEPYLHVSVGLQTYSSLAPYMNPNGALVNPIGQVSLPTDGPVGRKVTDLLAHWSGRIRILMTGIDKTDAQEYALRQHKFSALLYRLGLGVDWNDCLTIEVERTESSMIDKILGKASKTGRIALASCRAIARAKDDPRFEQQRVIADRVFRRLELQCPHLFGPPGMVSEHGLDRWERLYPNSDAIASVSFVHGVIINHARSNIDRYLGTVDEVLSGRAKIDCAMWSLVTPD